jgi:hypothetical protein
LFAQFETGEVLGTVRDQKNDVVAKATVTLLNPETGISVRAQTDDSGNYDFPQARPGLYTVSAEFTGFSKAVAPDVRVDVNARQRVDLTLQVGQVTESIEVTGAASSVETDSSEKGQVVHTQQIVELPLNGRNYSDLALLATNTHKSPMAISFSPTGTPREGAINVNGMRSTYNNFLLDGVDNNAYSPSNQGYSSQVVQPSPDAISEFKVITSSFSAEYGRVGGGIINAALRSGSNQFHGTAYEFLRNTDLNAIGFFQPTGGVQPTLQRNQFGVTIGGPFIKNKLFFFADYEGYRQLQRYLNFDSLPSVTDRAGILNASVTNPLTGSTYAAGTQIPISQINPFAATVLNNLPAPTGPGESNNYQALLPIRDYSDKYDAKIDYHINDKMNYFIRFSQRKDLQYYAPDIPGPSGGNGNGSIHAVQQQAATGYTWTVTPTSLLEARFAFDHVLGGKVPPYLGGPSMQALYGGFQGLPTSSDLTGGLNSQSVSGFSQFGRQTSNPQYQNPTSFNPKVNYSMILGRHSLKFGWEFVGIRTEVLDVNPLYGADTYAGQFSKPPGGSGAAATYNLADFIFGLPSTINLGNKAVTNLRQHVHSLYAQDDFRVTNKLTLNLGLRWEYATPIWERDNHWSNFDPATNSMIQASNGGIFNRALVHPDYHDFGPRVGMAYSFDTKTVMRAGYGISYSFFNRPGSAQEGINAPYALFGVLSQSAPTIGSTTFLTTQNSFSTGINNPANFNPLTSNVDYIDPNTRWPMIQSWFFSIQRELFKDTVVELAYNGNRSTRMPIIADYNQAVPNLPGQSLSVAARVPIQTFGPITWLTPQGNNNFNGMSARFERRFSHGLYFLDSFTWSKALGNSEQALEYFAGYYEANPQNIRNLPAERGLSSFDIKLNNVASVVYQLPFGRGRQFGGNMNRVLDAIVGGWDTNSIVTTFTGPPLDVSYSPSAANSVSSLSNDYRGQPFLRPNVSGSSIDQSKGQLINTYFAGFTFATPLASNPFGNAGRNAFRGPWLAQWDFAVNKSFRIVEGVNLQFRSEFFNVINHTNFGIPNTQTTSAAFGTIRTTYPPRQIQFALKLLF